MDDTMSECVIMDQEKRIHVHGLEYQSTPNTNLHKNKPVSETVTENLNALSQHITPMQKMVAACFGALLTSLFTTPFDVVKTRLQSQSLYKSYSPSVTPCHGIFFSPQNKHREFYCRIDPHVPNRTSAFSCAATINPTQFAAKNQFNELNGSLDGVVKIVRNEGVTSLWRGLSPALIMSVPVTVIYFVGYDHLRDALWKHWKGKYSETYSPLLAGAIARTLAVTSVSPLELFRTRMQGPEGAGGLKGVMNGVRKMVKLNGVSSLWRGLEPTLLRDVPFSAIYWTGYEIMKRNLGNYLRKNNLEGTVNNFEIAFICGATSGMVAAVVTTPFDVAKTVRQVTVVEKPSMIKIMKTILQKEGYRGLFKGGSLRTIKVAVSCALMISTYESLSTLASKIN
ncbi:hypothetical protein Glove_345g14 [Diversispora epigaea]|uniref:Mitochondrial carrier protein n=1 Tax=Diversispora epigaea TaxID=1348612 RepID=A0A397HN24_9GLOM|nr:hypothetical protein Glove_345g14 [Diversispora epigaea]